MRTRANRPLIASNAVGVGLAALIPLPFLDELVRRELLRASYLAAAQDAGGTLGAVELDALVRGQGSVFWAVMKAIFIWPLRKLFRTIFYFLTIKDALDWATEAAIRSEMVHMASVAGALPARPGVVRAAMDEVLQRHRYSPVTRWLHGDARPEMDWPSGSVSLVGGVGTLVRWGGGAVILADFAGHLGDQRPPDPGPVDAAPGTS